LTYLLGSYPDLSGETTASYGARNAVPHPIASNMSLTAPYALLSDEEFNQIFSSTADGWQELYARYPDARGMTELSRVGFNAGLDQALVYVGFGFGDLAGQGIYFGPRAERGLDSAQDRPRVRRPTQVPAGRKGACRGGGP
jgi:hypothetical protein